MNTRIVLDVAPLPRTAFGARALTWWGTMAFMALEGMGFALAIGAYLYLRTVETRWPMQSPLPNPWLGGVIAIILVLSIIPNHLLNRWAHAYDLSKVRVGLVLMSLLGIAPLIVRWFEFSALRVYWDTDAYGSAVWFLIGLHTLHLLTDVADTLVLAVLMFTRHGYNGRRFSDVTDNAFYWDFVVGSWLVIYFVIYWVPRL